MTSDIASGRSPQTSVIPFNRLRYNRETWVRDAVDTGRVDQFAEQIKEGQEFPPIEVVPCADGNYLIGDGIHRSMATHRLGRTEIEAVIVTPQPNESPEQCAYRIALEMASKSALPLTGAERRRAAVHLLETQPELSRRQIALLVGVSHSSVNQWAIEVDECSTPDDEADRRMPVGQSPDRVAARMASMLDRLSDSRGLLDYLAPKRMGRHLAEAFADRFGDTALDEARRLRTWLDGAVSHLEAEDEGR
jgi:hypothetical protein